MSDGMSLKAMLAFSWEKSKGILLPFQFKRWLKLLIVVWLAAAGIQGCGTNFQSPTTDEKTKAPATQEDTSPKAAAFSGGSFSGNRESIPQPVSPAAENSTQDREAFLRTIVKKFGGLAFFVSFMIALGVGFMITFMWLSCRFNFVLLETLVERQVAIRESFFRHKLAGDSYFRWSLEFLGVGVAAMSIGAGVIIGFFWFFKEHPALNFIMMLSGGFLSLAVFLGMIVIGILVHDFILPLMYQGKISVKEAWRQILGAGNFRPAKIMTYFLTIIGLGLVAGILQAVVSVIVMIVAFLAGGITVVPGLLLIKAAPLLKIPLLFVGAMLLTALIVAAVIAIGMVMLPAAIFLRVFALTYLTRLYPACDLLKFKS